jgi:glucose/arabinose dehydrogenase
MNPGPSPATLLLLLSLGAAAAFLPSCSGIQPSGRTPTRVVSVSPRDGARDMDPRTIAQIHFSTGLKLSTIKAEAIHLLGPDSAPVPARLGFDIEGDVVNIQPGEPLLPRTSYSLEVTAKLMDSEGASVEPFLSTFTTGAESPRPIAGEGFRFAKTRIDDEKGPTSIAVGPDGHVYVASYYGMLRRLRIVPGTGLAAGEEELLVLEGRKVLGLAFDPLATPADLVAWITHDERKAEDVEGGTFSGVVSRVRIPAAREAGKAGGAEETPFIVGLPSGWHPLNGCAFGPDGRLYISVGSMNRLGDDPIRPETPLSAAVLAADVRSPAWSGGKLPLDARTSSPVRYDPWAATAPLRLYATGFREMYGPCWHTNGSFYGGVNQNDGTGRADTPGRPGVPSLRAVFPDEDLVRIVEGAYYGHPNPSRKEYVLMGGNPTAGEDPWEIPEYPVGVQPEPHFDPGNLIFNLKTINGTSANGCAEYTCSGPLQGRLLVCFYEGAHTIHTFALSSDGKAVMDSRPLLAPDGESLQFTQPLDVAVHPSGRIYVADFGDWGSFGGGGAIWVLEPVGGN